MVAGSGMQAADCCPGPIPEVAVTLAPALGDFPGDDTNLKIDRFGAPDWQDAAAAPAVA